MFFVFSVSICIPSIWLIYSIKLTYTLLSLTWKFTYSVIICPFVSIFKFWEIYAGILGVIHAGFVLRLLDYGLGRVALLSRIKFSLQIFIISQIHLFWRLIMLCGFFSFIMVANWSIISHLRFQIPTFSSAIEQCHMPMASSRWNLLIPCFRQRLLIIRKLRPTMYLPYLLTCTGTLAILYLWERRFHSRNA